jgi:hypothetical protein
LKRGRQMRTKMRKIWINVRLLMINAIVPSYQILEGFFEANTVAGTLNSPVVRRPPDIDENSRQEGWNDLVASIKEHHASRSGTTNRTLEGDLWEENLDPVILAVIQNITRQPADDDYAMWRVRCKVIPLLIFNIVHL